MRAGPWLLPVLFFGLTCTACRTQPIYNVSQAPLPLGAALSMQEIGQAIQRAGASRGWSIAEEAPGHMVGTLNLRKHVAVVTITYDTKSFSIRYRDSTNLRYDGDAIHRNYNRWVRALEQEIREELFARAGS